jgi:hypothetical protein
MASTKRHGEPIVRVKNEFVSLNLVWGSLRLEVKVLDEGLSLLQLRMTTPSTLVSWDLRRQDLLQDEKWEALLMS